MNNRPVSRIDLYTWKAPEDANSPQIKIRSMNNINPERYPYIPEVNAKNVARLFSFSLPGNTNDVIYDAIAEQLLPLIKNNPVILLQYGAIQNHVRIAIEKLANVE